MITYFDLGGHVKIKVTDEVIGISEISLNRIFNRFTQVDSINTRAMDVTELGLAIIKSLIEGMARVIRVESKVSHGSNFITSLPKA